MLKVYGNQNIFPHTPTPPPPLKVYVLCTHENMDIFRGFLTDLLWRVSSLPPSSYPSLASPSPPSAAASPHPQIPHCYKTSLRLPATFPTITQQFTILVIYFVLLSPFFLYLYI